MGAFTGPVASAAWILARAAGHLPSATTASVLFGKGVYPLTRPGETPTKVTDFTATASSESACRAIDALDGALDLASPGTARLLVIVSDTWFVAPGEPAGAQPRNLLTASLAGSAIAYFLLFTSSSLAAALPAAVAVGLCGSMSLITAQTTLQRVTADAVLGRVSAVFLTGEAAATLIGSVAGPFIAQAAHLAAAAAAASLLTLSAAALAFLTVPRMPATIISPPPSKPGSDP
jgi:hypothetical protein